MHTLKDIVDYLNELLDPNCMQDFGPNGLQVEGTKNNITKICTAVSASLETINSAIDQKAQVLLVHHGIFWNKDSYVITGVKKEKIKLLLDNGISLLAYHLPLDCNPQFGNNFKAAKDLGWKNLKGFGQLVSDHRVGVQGKFDKISIEEFKLKLEKYYNHEAHSALGGKTHVESAALISGGAHREIHEAIKAEVDCFITGSFDEPIWHIANEEKINFFAMGHSNSEEIGPKAIGKHLSEKFKIEHKFLNLPNPF